MEHRDGVLIAVPLFDTYYNPENGTVKSMKAE